VMMSIHTTSQESNNLDIRSFIAPVFLALLLTLGLTGCSHNDTPESIETPSESSTESFIASDIASSSSSVEAETASANHQQERMGDAELARRLTSDLQSVADSSGMQTCIAVIDLDTNTHADFQGGQRMVSASMIKLAIAKSFLEYAKAESLSLDDTYTLQYVDIVGGTGVIGGYGAGAQLSYRELVSVMISASDNTATNILIRTIGMDAVNAECKKVGLESTELNRYMMDSEAIASGIENYTSANDVATLLRMVHDGSFVDQEASTLIMRALEQQQDAGGIINGLPEGVLFAHKTGSLTSVRHDGGIVECDHPFVIVVLCGGDGFYEQGAFNAMSAVAAVAYDDILN